MQRPFILVFLVLLVLAAPLAASDSPQFRGPERDGVYPAEGLLQTWPEGGPPQLWEIGGLDEGFSSVTVADGMLYTTGHDAQLNGFVYAYNLQGEPVWKRSYGKVHDGGGYPGTRTTPTWDDGALFLNSSAGRAFSLDAKTGAVRWEVDLNDTFGARNIRWGITESPLVLGDHVILTPGGANAALVALHKDSGEKVWATTGLDDRSAYCSPRFFKHGEIQQIVTLTDNHLLGVDPESGDVRWKTGAKASYDIHAVSPLFHGNTIIVSDGYGQGTRAYTLAADGSGVTKAWEHEKLDVHHGGAVLVDGVYYGAADKGVWYALDAATGTEKKASSARLGKGSVVYADGRLYGYTEKGEILLVDPADLSVQGKGKITAGDGKHWAHPVISNGVLYVRHGDALVAFNIKK